MLSCASRGFIIHLTVRAIDCSVKCSHSGVAFWGRVLDGLRVRLRVGMKIIMGTSSSLRRPWAAPRAGVSKVSQDVLIEQERRRILFRRGKPKVMTIQGDQFAAGRCAS